MIITQMQVKNLFFQKNILDYYKEIKDTLNYITRAVTYYDRFLMTVSLDQVQKMIL